MEKRAAERKETKLKAILVCNHSPYHVNITNCSENGMYVSLDVDCSPCNPNIDIFVEGINKTSIENDSRMVGKIVRALIGNDENYFLGIKLTTPPHQFVEFVKNL